MSEPDLGRDSIVWVKARVVDPPDHFGFIRVAIETGYTAEPEKNIEVHAASIRGFKASSTPPAGPVPEPVWIWCPVCNQESRHIKRTVPGISLWECQACNWRK